MGLFWQSCSCSYITAAGNAVQSARLRFIRRPFHGEKGTGGDFASLSAIFQVGLHGRLIHNATSIHEMARRWWSQRACAVSICAQHLAACADRYAHNTRRPHARHAHPLQPGCPWEPAAAAQHPGRACGAAALDHCEPRQTAAWSRGTITCGRTIKRADVKADQRQTQPWYAQAFEQHTNAMNQPQRQCLTPLQALVLPPLQALVLLSPMRQSLGASVLLVSC